MNIFAGGRRIAVVGGAFILICCIFALAAKEQTPDLKYIVSPFGAVAASDDDNCRIGIDGIERDTKATKKGITFSRKFCFVAIEADDGRLLVPYKVEGKNIMLDTPYAEEVEFHMRHFVSGLQPTEADFAKAESERTAMLAEHWGIGLAAAVAGLLFYWLVVWTIGWVMRGFMGVPRGQDIRVNPQTREA